MELDLIITKTQEIIGSKREILTNYKLQPFLKGFRGKVGYAIAAVSPVSTVELYKLIQLYQQLNIGYILQGANTALKGQGTPNGTPNNPVVIIRTNLLKKYKILDYPDNTEFKIMLTEPGLSLKEAEVVLNKIDYDLPHKIGSHDLGNTFGASCANGCGGVRVDNRDGRSSMTETSNMGVVAISANGIIYNGFIRHDIINSGEDLLNLIDSNTLNINDIELPDIHEIDLFLKKLTIENSYPIHNHRGDIIFAGDGGEGLQAIAYQMYLIRKKPTQIKTYGILFTNLNIKEQFYKEVIFLNSTNDIQDLPILCESMNVSLVTEIVKNGIGYLNAFMLALAPKLIGKYTAKLLRTRMSLIKFNPRIYIYIESFIGKLLSPIFTTKALFKLNFKELLVVQTANRNNTNNIYEFEKRLNNFILKNSENMVLRIKSSSFKERLLLQIRNVAAITTLTLSQQQKGELLAFDDAIMPGKMLNQYSNLLFKKLSEMYPGKVLAPYIYGHDLKQINHNDWIIKRQLSAAQLKEIHQIQHIIMESIGGIPHAEHGVGDYSDTDLNHNELVKLVAHRLLNDINGLANPGGGPEMAFQKALQDSKIIEDGIILAKESLKRELVRKTLLNWHTNDMFNLMEKLDHNIALISHK